MFWPSRATPTLAAAESARKPFSQVDVDNSGHVSTFEGPRRYDSVVTSAQMPSTPPAAARAPRRAPGDLPFHFADQALAETLAAERWEPEWLRDERVAASVAFEAMPVEGNQLYTPYVDLRAAALD